MGDVDYMISKLRGTAGSSVGTGAVKETLMRARTHCGTVPESWRRRGAHACAGSRCSGGVLRDEPRAAGEDGLVGNILFALFVFWVIPCYTAMCWLAWKRPSARERARRCEQPPKRAAARRTRGADELMEMEEHGASGCKHARGATYVRMLMMTTIINLKRKLERCTYYSFSI